MAEPPVEERLAHALVKGIVDHVEADVEEARQKYGRAARRHRGPAHGRHERRRRPLRRREDVPAAGRQERPRHEEGGRVPEPFMEAERETGGRRQGRAGKILLATVKGDVHDIGKNIVGVVLACNDYEVVDLGVMVPADRILKAREGAGGRRRSASRASSPRRSTRWSTSPARWSARGSRVPLLIGGATTSPVHTAVKIAPAYSRPGRPRPRRLARRAARRGRSSRRTRAAVRGGEPSRTQERLRREHERRVGGARSCRSRPRARSAAVRLGRRRGPGPAFTGRPRPRRRPARRARPLHRLVARSSMRGSCAAAIPQILADPAVGDAGAELFDDARRSSTRSSRAAPVGARRLRASSPPTASATTSRSTPTRPAAAARDDPDAAPAGRREADGEPLLSLADFVAPRESGAPTTSARSS